MKENKKMIPRGNLDLGYKHLSERKIVRSFDLR